MIPIFYAAKSICTELKHNTTSMSQSHRLWLKRTMSISIASHNSFFSEGFWSKSRSLGTYV